MFHENARQHHCWFKVGKAFRVEARHWIYYGENRFNVYVYLFPKHPLFDKCEEDIWGCPDGLTLHWGSTYCHWVRDKEGVITCKSYGSDYEHLGDHYTGESNPMNTPIFYDAQTVFDELEKMKMEANLEI
jgi:hypothetical protein